MFCFCAGAVQKASCKEFIDQGWQVPLYAIMALAKDGKCPCMQSWPWPSSVLHPNFNLPRSDVSPKEKLVGYIIKNPPEEKLSKAEKK